MRFLSINSIMMIYFCITNITAFAAPLQTALEQLANNLTMLAHRISPQTMPPREEEKEKVGHAKEPKLGTEQTPSAPLPSGEIPPAPPVPTEKVKKPIPPPLPPRNKPTKEHEKEKAPTEQIPPEQPRSVKETEGVPLPVPPAPPIPEPPSAPPPPPAPTETESPIPPAPPVPGTEKVKKPTPPPLPPREKTPPAPKPPTKEEREWTDNPVTDFLALLTEENKTSLKNAMQNYKTSYAPDNQSNRLTLHTLLYQIMPDKKVVADALQKVEQFLNKASSIQEKFLSQLDTILTALIIDIHNQFAFSGSAVFFKGVPPYPECPDVSLEQYEQQQYSAVAQQLLRSAYNCLKTQIDKNLLSFIKMPFMSIITSWYKSTRPLPLLENEIEKMGWWVNFTPARVDKQSALDTDSINLLQRNLDALKKNEQGIIEQQNQPKFKDLFSRLRLMLYHDNPITIAKENKPIILLEQYIELYKKIEPSFNREDDKKKYAKALQTEYQKKYSAYLILADQLKSKSVLTAADIENVRAAIREVFAYEWPNDNVTLWGIYKDPNNLTQIAGPAETGGTEEPEIELSAKEQETLKNIGFSPEEIKKMAMDFDTFKSDMKNKIKETAGGMEGEKVGSLSPAQKEALNNAINLYRYKTQESMAFTKLLQKL